ncbi:MAG: hypothetical protein EP330_20770 [Deltaproteobacteria bacterium]|nr:MAG: hypothetical protein EP330_20770 [Deltaproteobacteria bacterium]
MRTLALSLALVLAVPALAQDPCPSTGKDLSGFYERAMGDFDRMDLDAFRQTRDKARTALGCLSGVVAPKDAAAYHRLEALAAFANSDEVGAYASFRRAHELQPDYDLPSNIAPAGHPLRVQFDRAREASPSPQDPLNMNDADTWVDGRGTGLRPREVPALLQVRKQGEVTYSGYLLPGMGAPSDATRKTKVTRTKEPSERVGHGAGSSRSGGGSFPTRRVVAGGGAAVALVGGIALLNASLGNRAEFKDTSTPYEDLAALKGKANRQFFGFELLTLTAVGLGTVAVLPDSSMPAWVP